jgi:transcriptional regulator with XRE-family HTH domain
LAQGKPQKALVKEGGITERTLQRAESGLPVSPACLNAIATRLGVPLEEIAAKQAIKSSETVAAEDITLSQVGGRRLIEWLQSSPYSVSYSFRVDPDAETAEHIANAIEFCGQHWLQDSKAEWLQDDKAEQLKPAERIRVIGALNEKIALLARHRVGIFAIQLYSWQLEMRQQKEQGAEISIAMPRIRSRLLIDFGPSSELVAKFKLSSSNTKKSVYERCAKFNIDSAIMPVRVEAAIEPSGDNFVKFYRECWNARAPHGDAKVIEPVRG